VHFMRTVAAVVALAAFTAPSIALNMNVFEDAPFTRLNADEVKQFRAFVIENLNSAADGATAQWSAPQTVFKSTVTLQKSMTEGKQRCRQIRIESVAQDRKEAGSYLFCKAEGSDWIYRTSGGKPKPTSK
jgi:surface antigen